MDQWTLDTGPLDHLLEEVSLCRELHQVIFLLCLYYVYRAMSTTNDYQENFVLYKVEILYDTLQEYMYICVS